LVDWIVKLFSNKTFCSKIADLICGVIQGSVIGLLMFLIYINELVTLLNSFGVKVKLFADDVKLYIKIVNGTDYDKLQATLLALCAWAEDWQLPISISKCCVLHIGKGNVSHQFFYQWITITSR